MAANNSAIRFLLADEKECTGLKHVRDIGDRVQAEIRKRYVKNNYMNAQMRHSLRASAWCFAAADDSASLGAASAVWRRHGNDKAVQIFEQHLRGRSPDEATRSITLYLQSGDYIGAFEALNAFRLHAGLPDTTVLHPSCQAILDGILSKGFTTMLPSEARVLIEASVLRGEKQSDVKAHFAELAQQGNASEITQNVFAPEAVDEPAEQLPGPVADGEPEAT